MFILCTFFSFQLGYSKDSEKQRETDMMSHPAVLSVIEMGISVDMVKKALLQVHLSTLSAENLLLKVWEIEEPITKETETTTETNGIRVSEEISNTERVSEATTNTEQVSSADRKSNDRLESIIEENKYLKDRQLCKICLDEIVSIVFLPCGHLVSCVDCSHAIRKCPICRVFVKGTVKSILS